MSRSQSWRNKKCTQLQKTLELCGKIVQSVIDEDEVESVKKMMAPKKRKREKKVVEESTTSVPKTPRAKKAVKVVVDLLPPIVQPSDPPLPCDVDSDVESDDSVVLVPKNT